MLTRNLLLTALAAVLAASGPASAATDRSGPVIYDGHAGLGASVYQPSRTDLEFLASPPGARVTAIADGTSNTIMFGVRSAAPGAGDLAG